MAMKEETWPTPLRCEKGHSYEERVLWKIHYIEEGTKPTNQEPEIRTLCRQTAGSPTSHRTDDATTGAVWSSVGLGHRAGLCKTLSPLDLARPSPVFPEGFWFYLC